jgi:cellulose synthase/poly-beta-1,6-N-acetylglucosamine synthase-like glycosyltransferase
MICQDKRNGMVNALNEGVRQATGDVIVKTDADCFWLSDSLRNAVKYIADPQVGCVAGVHIIKSTKDTSSVMIERTYRTFYKPLRVGESKLHSTVLYEGELMVVKRDLIDAMGFDEEIGADDVPTALRTAERGYRAITAEDAYFIEQTPHTWSEKFRQKVRRGRHVFQALWKYRYMNFQKNTALHRLILPFETYIYVANPFVTAAFVIASIFMALQHPWLLLLLLPLVLISELREMLITHLIDSAIMVYAISREFLRRESVMWQKIGEAREVAPTIQASLAPVNAGT